MMKLPVKFIRFLVFIFIVVGIVSCSRIGSIHPSSKPTAPLITKVNVPPSSSPQATETVSTLLSPSPLIKSTNTPTKNLSMATHLPTPSRALIYTQPTKTPTASLHFAANRIRTMFIDQNGDLWTGGPGGVVHWDVLTAQCETYTSQEGLTNDDVTAIVQTADGSIWFGTFGGGISRFDGTQWHTYTTQDGLPGNYITSLVTAHDGTTIWADTLTSRYKSDSNWAGHFGQFDGSKWISGTGRGYDNVVAAPDGSFWASSYFYYLWHFNGNELGVSLPLKFVTALSVAQDGVTWVATTTNAYKITGSTLDELNPPWIGQTETSVTTITIDPNGIVWFGFSYIAPDLLKCGEVFPDVQEQGVYRYDGKDWFHYTTEDGLADNKICAAVTGKDGSVWFGTYDKGVSRFDGHNWITYTVP